LIRAFNMALKQREKRTYLKARWIGFKMTILMLAVLLIAIAGTIAGKVALNFVNETVIKNSDIYALGINVLGFIIVFGIFLIGISCLYYFGPAIKRKFKFFNIGALISSLLCIGITNLFAYYIENFNNYNRLYGSIGTLIAIMVWVYLIALTLILGFEVNIGLRSAKIRTHTMKNGLNPQDEELV
ncbi:MAG: YihY/virulence factor BrkB family protein, partial [Leadbetterella sp.]